MKELPILNRKDLKSDQEVRWCPGCDDYAILSAVQKTMAGLGIAREDFCVVSGIGCSSRFPYYMNTFGFHGIHGRALPIATGIKIANPRLSVWVATGDGDALSIGGNHLIHTLRRNVDLNILLFNNEIYGLTKGQYSPTSREGQVTKASPFGTVERPFDPVSVALGAGATFVARCIAADPKQLVATLEVAAKHEGTSFIEILQNCVIFNDDAFDAFAGKRQRADRTVNLVDGEKIVFGADREHGLRFDGFSVVRCSAADASTWDAGMESPAAALLLAGLGRTGDLPLPLGIFRDVEAPSYERQVHEQVRAATEQQGRKTLEDLVHSGETWTVD
jgi:2-oxoglutarate/2-oxoacid ferredoxin oxidoreductase subunit beta